MVGGGAKSECDIVVCASGTDVAKEAADLVMTEKDLTVLAAGVIAGRTTYGGHSTRSTLRPSYRTLIHCLQRLSFAYNIFVC